MLYFTYPQHFLVAFSFQLRGENANEIPCIFFSFLLTLSVFIFNSLRLFKLA